MDHEVVTRDEWERTRQKLLTREKEHTKQSDELARQRRELPWVKLEKRYELQTAEGPRNLADLFEGSSQLAAYHFMFGPNYGAGCPTCSSIADSFNGVLPHLKARDITFICISGAPIEKLLAYRKRMGWNFNWASSYQRDFNFDFGLSSTEEATREWAMPMVDQLPPIAARNASESGTDVLGYLTENFGFSVFTLDQGTVYQTYSTGGRGVEFLMGYYGVLDRTPLGRQEGDDFQMWIHRHDEYD